jgi:SAM-dependent methyltransferase
MSYKGLFYPESRFGGFSDIDGTIAFYMRVNALLKPSDTVLDVGCGRGAYQDDPIAIRRNLRILKGKVKKVIGIDVDAAAQSNPFLDEFRFIGDDEWPIEADSVDLILSDYVLEHIVDVDRFFFEARRVLKNGGYLCIRTSNRWSYIGLFSRLIPNQYHWRVTKLVQDHRKEEDVFPAVYRCNSVWQIRSKMRQYGFDGVVYGYEAEPSYLSFSKIAYWLGVLHQRFAPAFLKASLFAFAQLAK